VRCKLHTVTLSPETYYVCLSYIWGDPTIKETIIVDGVRRKVTVNLATALKHLKQHWINAQRELGLTVDTSKFRVWADALCINQNDLLERTHQVGLMADIYSTAEMVLAWLSSDDGDVSMGFEALERVYLEVIHHLQRREESQGTSLRGIWISRLTLESESDMPWLVSLFTHDGEPFDKTLRIEPEETVYCLFKLWNLSFWSRVWIQQEVILAKRLYFVSPSNRMCYHRCLLSNRAIKIYLECGLERLHTGPGHFDKDQPWQELARRLLSFPMQPGQMSTILQWQRGTVALLETKRAETVRLINGHGPRLPGSDLFLSGHLQATDKLDYVYGMLAVMSQMPIVPDYTKSIKEVFVEFTKWVVPELQDGGAFAGFLDTNSVGLRQLHGLPTWAPIFSPDEK
jgi:hypothetical protein